MKDFDLKAKAKEVLTEINAELKTAGLNEWGDERLTRQEGGNGHSVGETVTLTSEVGLADVTDANGKVTNKYLAVKATDGSWFSLKNLIRPNLTGYQLKGIFLEDEDGKGEIKDGIATGETNAKAYEADVDSEFDKDDQDQWFDAKTKNLIELYALIKEGEVVTEGVTLKYRGRAMRSFIAKKPSKASMFTKYKKGAHRVMRQAIWTIA